MAGKHPGLPADEPISAGNLMRRKYGMQAGNIVGIGSFIPSYTAPKYETGQSENITPNWMVGGCGVEGEVDTETGPLRLVRFENVVDSGTPIHPKGGGTQVSEAG